MDEPSARYQQSQLFVDRQDLITSKKEDHWFDRKSIRIQPDTLANTLVAFANAEGGTILIGVNDAGEIEGIDKFPDKVNELRWAAVTFTTPPVTHSVRLIECTSRLGMPDHVLALEVPPSSSVHKNKNGDAYRRAGSSNRKLGFEELLELSHDKGLVIYDSSPVAGSTYRDLNANRVEEFVSSVGGTTDPKIILKARGLLAEQSSSLVPTVAAVLLFSDNPERFIPSAFVRVLKYNGTQPQYGRANNASFDQRISGSLVTQIAEAERVLSDLLPNFIRFSEATGRFETVPSIPKSVWYEAIVNAVTHRSYSQQGDHIRIALFDDSLEVSSPGRLPGLVRLDNIRYTRFARNPRIARVLADLELVKELNEGINRMFSDMALAGLPEPELRQPDAGFKVTLYARTQSSGGSATSEWDNSVIQFILQDLNLTGRASIALTVAGTGLSAPTVRRHFQRLSDAGIIERVARSATDPRAYWILRQTEYK